MIDLKEANVGDHVIASIRDLKNRIDKKPIDFNKLLPTDINSDMYDISNAKKFNDLEKQFAQSVFGTRDSNNTTGILGIALKIASEFAKEEDLKNLNCSKAIDVITGTKSKGLQSDDRDIYAIAASCAIIANALSKKGKDLDKDYSDKQGEGKPKEEFEKCYQLPNVSPDNLMNEIYSYIMSKK